MVAAVGDAFVVIGLDSTAWASAGVAVFMDHKCHAAKSVTILKIKMVNFFIAKILSAL